MAGRSRSASVEDAEVKEAGRGETSMGRVAHDRARSDGTRTALMSAAERLWSARGFDAVPVEEICAAAGVAKGTFYVHFPRKEHLLVMIAFSCIVPRERDVLELLGSDATTSAICDRIVRGIVPKVAQLDRGLVQRAVEESFGTISLELEKRVHGGDRTLARYFQPIMRRGQDRGEISRDWDPSLIASTLGTSIRQGILHWSSGTLGDKDFERTLRARVALVLNGAANRCLLPK